MAHSLYTGFDVLFAYPVPFPGVALRVDFLEIQTQGADITLGGPQLRMAEHLLYRRYIRPVLHQLGGKSMAEGMGRDPFLQAAFLYTFTDHEIDHLLAYGLSFTSNKEESASGIPLDEAGPYLAYIFPQEPDAMLSQRDHPIFSTLALVDPQHLPLEIGIVDGKLAEFTQPDAGCIQHFKDCPVADPRHGAEIGLLKKECHFLLCKHCTGNSLFLFRFLDSFHGIDEDEISLFQELEEPFQGTDFEANGGGCIFAKSGNVFFDISSGQAPEIPFLFFQE
jgi:hypothetical protein